MTIGKSRKSVVLVALTASLMSCVNVATAFSAPGGAARQAIEIREAGLPPMIGWVPSGTPRATILCIHGLGLHKGSYSDLGEKLAAQGFAVYAIDVRGFGAWYTNNQPKLDFPATLTDIGNAADYVLKHHPNTPMFLVGESMGGGVALHAAAKYQDKFAGLICAAASGDRFAGLGQDLHLTWHVLTGGFKERFNVGAAVIKNATKDEQHAQRWANDPMARKDFSAGELLTFQNLMKKNFEAAHQIQSMPVLVIEGQKDTLVRQSGNSAIFDQLMTPSRTHVVSKDAEHLIFENGQTNEQDLNYVVSWIKKNEHPATASKPEPLVPPPTDGTLAVLPPDAAHSAPSIIRSASNISFWIELKRNGETFRCNNKTAFKSGDEIRFHLTPGLDGFAYILMKQGTTGGHAILFPEARTGTDNAVVGGKDCPIPTMTYLRFDDKPGIEKMSLIFSRKPIDLNNVLRDPHTVTAYVSPDRSGSKDLVPTRMQLSWDDPAPVLMPSYEPNSALASNPSAVRLGYNENDTVALEIALEHE